MTPLQDVLEGLRTAVSAGGNVLICGEPGAGHERVARAIHHGWEATPDGLVERLLHDDPAPMTSARPFVVVDCARAGDLERRLLGVDGRGSPDRDGLERVEAGSQLHAALSGTLVLRHITELPRRLQAKLARILRDDEVELADQDRVAPVQAGIRAIATVESDLQDATTRGLQPELFKRLSSTIIDLLPLRRRRAEIPALATTLLNRACAQLGITQKTLSSNAAELLSALEWRGNIDELSHTIWSLASNVPGPRIRMTDVLARVRFDGRATLLFAGTLREARAQFEREYVAYVLEQHDNHITEAAKALGIQRTNLYRKLRQLSVARRKHRLTP